jgi:hypothetical protein
VVTEGNPDRHLTAARLGLGHLLLCDGGVALVDGRALEIRLEIEVRSRGGVS